MLHAGEHYSVARNDHRYPHRLRPKGPIVMRHCLKCGKEFEAVAHYHICQPCTWRNNQMEVIYGSEGMQAPPWWH